MQTEGLSALYRHISFTAIAERAVPGSDITPRNANALFSKYIADMNSYAAKMKGQQAEVAFMNYRLNRTYPELTFRVVYADGHFEFYIATMGYEAGRLVIIDLFDTYQIEPLTDLVRRLAAPQIKASNLSRWNKLFRQPPAADSDPFDTWRLVIAAANGNNYEALLKHHEQLLPELKETPTMRALHLLAVSKVRKDQYRATWDACFRDLSDQTGMVCMLLDASMKAKNAKDGIAAITALEKLLGEDRFFHFLRADFFVKVGALDAAFTSTGQSLAQFRRYDYRSRSYLYLCMNMEKWQEAAVFLRELERDTGKESVAFLAENPQFASIANSDAFKSWLRSPIKRRYDPELLARVQSQSGTAAAYPARPVPVSTGTAPVQTTPSAPAAPYTLKGIIYSSRPSATINNKFVMVGDKVGAAKVLTIETNYVVIEVDGKQEKLTLTTDTP